MSQYNSIKQSTVYTSSIVEILRDIINDKKVKLRESRSLEMYLTRKFWFRMNLFMNTTYQSRIMFMGIGNDTMYQPYVNSVCVDLNKADHIITLDVDKELDKVFEIIKEKKIEVVVGEGFFVYLKPETARKLFTYFVDNKIKVIGTMGTRDLYVCSKYYHKKTLHNCAFEDVEDIFKKGKFFLTYPAEFVKFYGTDFLKGCIPSMTKQATTEIRSKFKLKNPQYYYFHNYCEDKELLYSEYNKSFGDHLNKVLFDPPSGVDKVAVGKKRRYLEKFGSCVDADTLDKDLSKFRIVGLYRFPLNDADDFKDIKHDVFVEVIYGGLEKLPEGLTEKEQSFFEVTEMKLNGKDSKVFYYSNLKRRGETPKSMVKKYPGFKLIYVPDKKDEKSKIQSRNDGELRKLSEAKEIQRKLEKFDTRFVKKIDVKTLAKKMVDFKKVLLLVGAGATQGVMYAKAMEKLVGQERGVAVDKYVHDILSEGGDKRCLKSFSTLTFNPFASKERSLNHLYIKEIAIDLKTQILTTNSDLMFENLDIRPLKIGTSTKIGTWWGEKECKKVDAIVCIGIGADRKSVLGVYKKNNPKGTIISIDLTEVD